MLPVRMANNTHTVTMEAKVAETMNIYNISLSFEKASISNL
jgi:glycine betaine/choline ABC-type transport system substrate-binding protein